jgi:predicted membrane channel-forming protein YqfA (hemolysin III family)
MKPQFSILTVLLITTYVAVVFAGIREPSALWAFIAAFVWIGILGIQLIVAFGQGDSAYLARGFLAAQLVAMVVIPMIDAAPLSTAWLMSDAAMRRELVHCHVSLAAGCLGSAAVYLRLGRRDRGKP